MKEIYCFYRDIIDRNVICINIEVYYLIFRSGLVGVVCVLFCVDWVDMFWGKGGVVLV